MENDQERNRCEDCIREQIEFPLQDANECSHQPQMESNLFAEIAHNYRILQGYEDQTPEYRINDRGTVSEHAIDMWNSPVANAHMATGKIFENADELSANNQEQEESHRPCTNIDEVMIGDFEWSHEKLSTASPTARDDATGIYSAVTFEDVDNLLEEAEKPRTLEEMIFPDVTVEDTVMRDSENPREENADVPDPVNEPRMPVSGLPISQIGDANNEKKCPFCSLTMATGSGLRRHVREQHYALCSVFLCNYCQVRTRRRENMKRHINLKHREVLLVQNNPDGAIPKIGEEHYTEYEPSKPEEGDVNETVAEQDINVNETVAEQDIYVNETVAEQDIYQHNMPQIQPWPKFNCIHCAYETNMRRNLFVHIGREHKEVAIIKCSTCKTRFQTQAELDEHVATKHPTREQIDCPSCSLKFGSKTGLRRHTVEQHNPSRQNYRCEYCDFTTYRKGNLKRHTSLCHRGGN